jgi:hypothetical protein
MANASSLLLRPLGYLLTLYSQILDPLPQSLPVLKGSMLGRSVCDGILILLASVRLDGFLQMLHEDMFLP